jgi:hypothetical protein
LKREFTKSYKCSLFFFVFPPFYLVPFETKERRLKTTTYSICAQLEMTAARESMENVLACVHDKNKQLGK